MSVEGERPLVFEVCVDSLTSLEAALAAGAERVELCAARAVGGLTPSLGAIQAAVVRCAGRAKLHVLIRPRAGDYHYGGAEVDLMEEDVALTKAAGADGVVIGALDVHGTIDVATCRRLVARARPLQVTFHRAFDATPDPLASLAEVAKLGVDRLLSSGGATDALTGAAVLAELVRRAGDELVVMAGGGITEDNVACLVERSAVREVHFSGRSIPPGGARVEDEELAARLVCIMASARRGGCVEVDGQDALAASPRSPGEPRRGAGWAT